jgi:hypothetical protein
MCRSGRSSVHEGGRPAERPHGAISNRQPLPRRNARTARCQSPAPPPAERPHGAMSIASPSPGGTPVRRDFQSPAPPRRNARAARCQSPAPQRTGQRPRRWTPGGTPARRDFQSPAPPPAERPHGAMSIASPSPGGTPARRDVNRQPLPRRNARAARFQSPAPQRTGQRPRRWTPGGTPARRDFQSPAPPPAERPHGAISNRQPLPRRNARAARFPIASPAADRAASTKVDARRNARTARFPIASPSPGGTPARRDVNRQPRSGRGSVHEGGRPAERPHGAISNRQPLPRRNARTARFPIASPSPGGTPARRDFQSPAPPPAERPRGAISNRQPLPRRNARAARFPIASPSPAERPRGAMSIASPAADRAASTKVDAQRNARTARCQSPAPPPAERPRGAMSIASPSPSGTPARRDVNRQPRSGRGSVHEGGRPAARPHGAMSIASPSPGGTPARRDVNRQPRSGRGSVHEGGRPAECPCGAISNRQPLSRRNARTARCQSPAPQRTGQRPRRWTPGGTPARRDFQSPAPLPSHPPTTARRSGRSSVG